MAEHAGRSKSELERLTRDELRELARGAGMTGFGSMRKSELVNALIATNSESEPESQPLQSEAMGASNGAISSAALFGSSSTKVALKNHRLATTDAAVTDSLDLTGLDRIDIEPTSGSVTASNTSAMPRARPVSVPDRPSTWL